MTLTPAPQGPRDPGAAPAGLVSRSGLHRLSNGLIGYGLVGLAIAIVGLAALLWVGGRVGGLADRTSAQVESIIATLDKTAAALDDAGTSAVSFAVTLERTPPIVRQAADTIGNLQVNLRAVEQQLASFSILGNQPLSEAARLFGQMATDLEGLDTRLDSLAAALDDNKASLLANAESLRALGVEIGGLADDLRTGIVEDSLADVQVIVTVLILVLVAWTAVPAAGALGVGWWLRRELAAVAEPVPAD
jgi:hypothetical protein